MVVDTMYNEPPGQGEGATANHNTLTGDEWLYWGLWRRVWWDVDLGLRAKIVTHCRNIPTCLSCLSV